MLTKFNVVTTSVPADAYSNFKNSPCNKSSVCGRSHIGFGDLLPATGYLLAIGMVHIGCMYHVPL